MRQSVKKKSFLSLLLIITLFMAIYTAGCLPDTNQAERGTHAIYIYMCGSNLETNIGAATKNIAEMLSASVPENTTVVIETGGSKKWRNYDIAPDKLSRYVILDGKLVLTETTKNANMGSADTLSDFLNYCLTEYPADRKGVILWDHGGGPINGVCNDEQYGMDSLTLGELNEAFESTKEHFDFIGFDACLMATLDTAATISDYSDYMIASEEIVSSGGWDYTKLIQMYTANVKTEDFGKAVCDSYIEKCKLHDKDKMATLSLFDLSKTESVRKVFDGFANDMEKSVKMKYGNFEILTAVDNSTKLGGNSVSEGYSNLIDLYNFADSLSESNASSENLCATLDDFIVYKVHGESRIDTGGVSLYYPIVYDENDLYTYLSISDFDAYKNYLNELYTNISDKTIEFTDKGSEAEDGSFQIALSADSKKFVKSVDFCLVELVEDEKISEITKISRLGLDDDIFKDWDDMKFHSNFRGIWLGINGKLLNYSVVECNNNRIIFTAPVIVNGRKTNLRFSFIIDDSYDNGGYYSMIGLWDGVDENGIADKEITPLKVGDKVTFISTQVNENDFSEAFTEGDTITIGESGATISEIPLSQKYYEYVYVVTDIFGNAFYSRTATFEMQYSYDELLQNPLHDGEYAAKIIEIKK